jgi:predicted O-methyltransferase YrrM
MWSPANSDPRFMTAVETLRVPGMGTDAVAPLLASLIHLIRPQRVLEVGMGYTTPFIAGALSDVVQQVNRESAELTAKTQDYLEGSKQLDRKWLQAEPSLVRPGYYLESYRPELVTVDDLSSPESSAGKVSAVLRDLKLDHIVTVINSSLRSCASQLPDSFAEIDLAWIDAWECLYFIENFWERINQDGGVVLMHYLMTYPEGEAILEYLESIQRSRPRELEIISFLEPHKLAQNSVTALRRVSGLRPRCFTKAGSTAVNIDAQVREDAFRQARGAH